MTPFDLLRHHPESVERRIPTSPDVVFDLLADPSRHPEIDGSGTVQQAEPTTLALGDTFGMAMKAGVSYDMVNTVIEFEPGRRIAWQARSAQPLLGKLIGGRIWRYELEPVADGTLVRETWDIRQETIPYLVAGLRGVTRRNMTRTLERLEKVLA